MRYPNDTIAAIATAPGEAGISIVRLSGEKALSIADDLYRGWGPRPSSLPGGRFVRGSACAPGGLSHPIDQVVLLVFRAPRSYTGEDVVELQGHGGRVCAQRLLRAALDAGARLAEPGEFTQRAFLNRRIDLLQAEAVADLIRSGSERAARAALEQLEGTLSRTFETVYADLLRIGAEVEACLDFAEEELPVMAASALRERIAGVIGQLLDLLSTAPEGRILREGARVVISGIPNVGKSTLLNVLVGKERAIVSRHPGTTRDTIEEHFVLEGFPLRVIDTAGLRSSACEIEREGVRRARMELGQADLTLFVVDASKRLSAEEEQVMQGAGSRLVVVCNKCDLGVRLTFDTPPVHTVVRCSLLNGTGLAELRQAILSTLALSPETPPHAAISERHRHIVQYALNKMNETSRLMKDEQTWVLAANTIRDTMQSLGEITGKTYSKSLANAIFSRFCIGK